MTFEERISKFYRATPNLHPSVFIAQGANLIGDVRIGADSSVWFQSVLRADVNTIEVGSGSNIQDGCVIHLADNFGTRIGDFVTVGHKAILHACSIGDEVLVGMNAVILDGAEIGARSIIGAGALITGGKKFPAGSLILGSPAKLIRLLSIEEQSGIKHWADKYVQLSKVYREG